MSDQGGPNEAGWQPDPHGRHEYRYWDGAAWTDQVSDGGVVATDPPGDATTVVEPVASPPTAGMPVAGPPSTDAPPYAAPTEDKPKGKVPVGLLALVGLAVAAIVAALVIFLGGGDDGGGGSGGTGSFAGSITDDDPFVVRTFDLEAGEAFRVIVEPDSDLDVAVTLGVSRDLAAGALFGGSGDESDLLSDFGFYYDDLFSDALNEDLSADLSSGLSDDFSDFQSQLSDSVPSLNGAGLPLGTTDENGDGEAEGSIFMAPLAGQYSIIVSGRGATGDFDAKIETTGPSEDFEAQDPDSDIDIQTYYAGIAPLRDFLCDEDFWGGDPADVSEDTGSICDDDSFDQLLSSDFSDFSDDASDFSDFSDFSDISDFSDDFSDFSDDVSDFSDFSDDFSDFSDDVPTGTDADRGPIQVGDSAGGNLDPGGRDLYTIDGPGSRVTIDVVGSNDTGGLDPTVTVEDSTGSQVGFNDDGDPSDIGDSRLRVRLDAGETYTIIVAGFSTTTGDYTMTIS